MDNLYDVCNCLSSMDSSKAIERKKNATQLEQLLGREYVVKAIDNNTVQGTDHRSVTWDVVLKGVNRYIDSELSVLQSAKESQSTTTLNNRDKKKQELLALFKLVVRTANKGSAKLSFNSLIDRIESMLTDAYTLETFGTDYSDVFLKYVLRIRPYWLKISPDKWRKLINLFCKLYDNNRVDQGILAQIIQDLMRGSCLQSEPYPRRAFSFFTSVLENIRDLKDVPVIENILTSLNIFCRAVAPNSRVQLCYFGESQMNGFVFLWGRHNTDKIKEELIEFLHLLVRAHHPNGVTDPSVGAYAHNWDLWKKHITFLHEMIVTDIDKITARYKFISGSTVSSPSYVTFAVDVFKQMPTNKLVPPDFFRPSSQASQSGNHGDSIGAGPTKRQRLSTENISLLEIINGRSNTLSAIPWLQLLHQLLNKYPESFGETGLNTTLQVMVVLLTECKRGQLFRYLFEVLSSLIRAVQQYDGLRGKVTDVINTIWSNCVSTINSRQAEVEGYQEYGFCAMSCMINSGLVSPTREIWNLFIPIFSHPSQAADQLLTSLITTQGLPETHVPSIIGTSFDNNARGKLQLFPLRQSLITWLLPIIDSESGVQFKATISPVRLAEILYALTLQDPSVIKNDLDCPTLSNSNSQSLELETTYLKSTFDHQFRKCQTTNGRDDWLRIQEQNKGSQQKNPHISVVLEFLMKHLFNLSSNLEQQTSDFLSWFSCLLSRLLYHIWEDSIVTKIQYVLKRVLGKMADTLVSQMQKDIPACLSSNLTSLSAALTWEEEVNDKMFLVAESVRSCLPRNFVAMLLDMASGKQLNKRKDSNQDTSRRSFDRPLSFNDRREVASTSRTDVDLDFDMFEAAGSSHVSHNNSSMMDFDGGDSLKDTDDVPVANQNISDFLRKENLTEVEQTRVLCTEVLCRLTSYDRHQMDGAEGTLTVKAEMDSTYVNSRLLQLISSECYNPTQAVHVHFLLTISKYLLTCEHEVSLKDLKCILTAFKQTAKQLHEDQQVCCRILYHLRYIIPHLTCDSDLISDDLKFCRDVFFKFVSDFWRLAAESTPCLKFEIAETLLDILKVIIEISQFDPDCTWGHLHILTDKRTSDFSLCTVAQHFPKLLSDGSVMLRTFMAESLKWLFVRQDHGGREILRDKNSQTRAFESVFELCSELLDIEQGNLNMQRWQDEVHNRQATCLHSLLTIIIVSPVCEKQCLLGLCQLMAEKNIPLDPVRKMLNIICQELKFVDIQSYLTCHLPYLIHNWLHQNMVNSPISQFPYKLLGYSSLEELVRSHRDLIVSELLVTKQSITDIHAVLDPVHMGTQEALQSALPLILSHVLPTFAAKLYEDTTGSDSHTSNANRAFARATECFTIVVSELSETTIKNCASKKLGDIIVRILNCLSVDKDVRNSKSLSMVYPEPNPPHYNHDRIQKTLDYLAQNFITGGSLTSPTLIAMLAKVPGGIYQVLLSLSSLVWHEHRPHEQQRYLHMYRLFVNMVLKQLNGGLENGWAAVVRDVVNRLLIVLADRALSAVSVSSPSYEEEVILTTLDILRAFCSTALQTCPEEMTNYIHRIIDTVASTLTLSEGICKSATDFLSVLLSAAIVSEDYRKAMRILNPLPSISGHSQLKSQVAMSGEDRSSLSTRLDNLIDVCLLMSNNPSQGLAERMNQLATFIVHNHSELEKVARSSEGQLILKKVLTELLKLMTSSHQVAVASAACLGAIGPIDLGSLSFPREPVKTGHVQAVETYKGHCFEKYCWVFHALDDCLLDKNLQLVKTAGDILKKVLATTAGRRFKADYSKALKNKSFMFQYLHPFKTSANDKPVMAVPQSSARTCTETFKMLIDKPDLWLGSSDSTDTSHEVWIKDITTALLNTGAVRDELLKSIGPMCALKSQFCEESLPYLIHDILESGDAELRQVLSSNISSFFHCHCISAQTAQDPSAHPICMNKQSVRTLLNVLQYLRTQKRPQERQEVPQTAWNNNFWLDVDYLEVARAALYCSANFLAVLFTEIWWDIQRNDGNQQRTVRSSSNSQSNFSQESQLDPLTLVSSQGEAGHRVQELLLESYRNIGDPDGIYGCGAGKLAHPMARVQTYLHEQQQEKALTTLDIGVSYGTTSVTLLLQTVESCGADYVLQRCLSELNYSRCEPSSSSSPSAGVAEELEEFHYQAAWKLGQWDISLPAKQSKSAPFHQSLYRALVSFKDGHLSIAKESLDVARSHLVKRFDPLAESCKSLYPFLSHLQCLTYLQEVLKIFTQLNNSSDEEILSLFADFANKVTISTQAVHFDCERSLLHLMASVATILTSKGIKQGKTLEIKALWSLAVGSRRARQYQLAEKALDGLKTKISSEQSIVTIEHVHLEEAKLFWARGEVDVAKNILKNLIGRLSKADTSHGNIPSLYPEALCTYGNWLAETKSETPTVIIREYLEKTVAMKNEGSSSISDYTDLEGFVSLARFADEQYQQIADHIRSPTFEDKQNLFQSLSTELKVCQEFKSHSKYVKTMEKTLALDMQEITSLQEAHGHFLLQALLNYLNCLRSGDLYNLKVFRVIALWFENSKNVQVNKLIKTYIGSVKTYKFLPLYYQLAARMSSVSRDDSKFNPVLTELMERVATDHPHHALWIIMALAHAYKDDELLAKEKTSKSRKKPPSADDAVEEERVQAAKFMLEKLRKSNRKMAAIVTNMEKLCMAYIELANFTVTNKTNRNPQPFPEHLAILRITECDNILLPSVELKVDPTGTYNNIISPVKFGTSFRVIGGINLPKIITCDGSDGKRRTQLVKGQDDLRQDAVMQQVFTLVNELLAGDVETQKRQLKIQTYKVIPLSQKCGLLQWCEGTQPLGEYLIGANGAHTRYRPNDWPPKTCRECLANAGPKAEQRLKAYKEICAKFKPVFHHFFLENFLEPSVWFEKRLAYTRSVATNSIVGYILGLGDRHLMNILIDLNSAEVVHIDLGIAFEQGRILPTPETVPFRLTRDIVDGMGITGVEGVFRRCCEKTMEVMKNNSESLLTILQVLLYDPLSHWSLTPQQALTIQRKREQANLDTLDVTVSLSGQVPNSGQISSSNQVVGPSGVSDRDVTSKNNDARNKLAERTLLRLRQKLVGHEDGVPLSVTGQVNLLIQKASDPDNLSMLYAGWQPYL